MYDNFAAWMIAGGLRAEAEDQRVRHLVAIGESRRAARSERPSLLDRVRVRFGVSNTAPAADTCTA